MGLPTIEEYKNERPEARKDIFKKYLEENGFGPCDYANRIHDPNAKKPFVKENYYKYTKIDEIQKKINEIKSKRTDYEEFIKNNGLTALGHYKEFIEQISQKNITDNMEQTEHRKKTQKFPLNQILYGPPGTGKTYKTLNKALAIIKDVREEDLDKDRTKLTKEFKIFLEGERIVFITFHQSMSYEDFIEGIKPKLNENQDENSKISYEIKPGIFKKICTDAEKDLDNSYILIIDEINRGNVSQIFGELITLIEEDKRLGGDEELSVRLPYSKEEFRVPDNLYIIGTMNTADRSVEALDTALRRRFSFIEMMPKPELLNSDMQGMDLQRLLKTINERIEKLLDREHQIGHSYFLDVEDLEGLKQVFKDKIIPLLQEYFFGDYGKIGLVLGKEFVEKISEPKFANFNYDIEDKDIYRLKISDNFKSIYE